MKLNIILSIAAILVFTCTGIVATSVNESEAIKSVTSILVYIALVVAIFLYGDKVLAPIEVKIKTLPILSNYFIKPFGNGDYLKGVIAGLIGAYVGAFYSKKAIKGDKEFVWMWRFFIQTLIERCGTIFTKSKLLNADFSGINLKGSCFKKAKFSNTKFRNATFLERADFRGTSLQKKSIQNLATIGDGCRQDFTGENLTEINLDKASLEEAILIRVNLIDSSLREANLSFANLKQAQLQGAILSNATLIGAYIEDWLIDRNTRLDNVICPYICISEEPNQQHKPENQYKFSQEDEFANYVRPQLETIDIFLKPEINYWAVAESLFELAENYPNEQLRVPIIEPVNNSSLLIRIPVVGNVNKSRLRREFIELYKEFKKTPQQPLHRYRYQNIIEEYLGISGGLILTIENKIYNSNQQGENSTMDNNNTKISGNENHIGDKNQINYTSGNRNNQVISGEKGINNLENMANNSNSEINYTPEQKTLAEAASEIQKLLKQLEQDNPTANEAEKVAYVNEETTASFKRRVVGALQAGGETAIDEFILENKYLKVVKATIKGWVQPDS